MRRIAKILDGTPKSMQICVTMPSETQIFGRQQDAIARRLSNLRQHLGTCAGGRRPWGRSDHFRREQTVPKREAKVSSALLTSARSRVEQSALFHLLGHVSASRLERGGAGLVHAHVKEDYSFIDPLDHGISVLVGLFRLA